MVVIEPDAEDESTRRPAPTLAGIVERKCRNAGTPLIRLPLRGTGRSNSPNDTPKSD
jgi:hypothetical protein